MFNRFLFFLRQATLPALLIAVLLPTNVSAAVPIVVDTNSFAPLNTGDTDGQCSLLEAVSNVNSWGAGTQEPFPDCLPGPNNGAAETAVIEIQPGIGTIDATGPMILRESVKIIGPSPTEKAVITSSSSTQGLFVIQPNSRASEEFEFRNLRIENVSKTDEYPSAGEGCRFEGGAICARLRKSEARLRLIDSEMVVNRAERGGGGGALYVSAGLSLDRPPRVLIDGTTIDRNEGLGAAVILIDVSTSVRNSSFLSNSSPATGALAAIGALGEQDRSSLSIDRSSFIGNESTEEFNAGALAVSRVGTVLITNSRFELNTVFDTSFGQLIPYRGHAIKITGPAGSFVSSPPVNLIMANNEISDNSAGGLRLNTVDATIASTMFANNRFVTGGPNGGTAVVLTDSALDLRNSSVIDNFSPSSDAGEFGVGGISGRSSTLTLEHVTISGNDTLGPPSVGGLWLGDNSIATLEGTLLAGNGAMSSNGNVFIETGSTLNMHSSQFGDSSSEINGANTANAFNDDAGLDPVQDMGCTVPAGAKDDARCVRLAPLTVGAVALDRSDPATSLTSDQRGSLFTRATGGGNLPDIGAHELQPPIISVDPDTTTARNEGDSGTTSFPFLLHRNGDTRDISFANWNVFGDGASPATVPDFSATSGSAFFDIGETSATVNVGVIGDLDSEPNEGFRLALAALTNGVPGTPSQRTGTIINDDALLPAPFVSITPVAINSVEGNFVIGSEQRFRLTRSQVLGGICGFQIELSAVGPAGVSDDDFVNLDLGTTTVIMGAGQEVADYVVQVAGDGLYEGDEAFRVELVNPSGCIIDNTASSVDAMIVDDEALYRVDADAIALFEGDAGTTPFTFTASRAGYLADTGSVDWEVVGFGGLPATADDFAGSVFPSGTALFLPGSDEFTITVEVVADDIGEFDEQFAVVISNPFGGEISVAEAVATIVNDDASDLLFSDGFE